MRKIVATEYVTLDGVMDEPGVWSGPFFNDEAIKFKYDELFASDALLLGRVTYEGFAKAWPTMEGTGDFGERMNGMPKYVVSTTLQNPEWTNTHVISANVVEEVSKLKEEPGQDLLLAGSGKLFHTLMERDLVDEYRLMLHPIVLGSGKKLFEDENQTKTLKLVEAKPFTSGIVILTYHPAERE
ncbi:MAG TPA: dihydrofolate reductase family protein [Ktedonobacterales bacterium]|jgi:dihydrofolate reductase